MKLLRLELLDVRGAPDGAYAFADARTGAPLDVVLVTGGPGAGKTSLLEAVAAAKEAVGSYGAPPGGKRLLRSGATRGRITATWVLSEAERRRVGLDAAEHTIAWELGEEPSRVDAPPALRRLFAAYSRDPVEGKVEYFPANRSLAAPRPGPPASEAAEARVRLGKDLGKYDGLVTWLGALALQDAARVMATAGERGVVLRKDVPDSLAPFREALAALLPDLRLAGVDLADHGALQFLRRGRETITLDDSSESERQGVLFALAFRGFGLERSLVLLDEPELHVHASDRVRFLQALVALGRDNQLIVATGAAEIAGAAARGQLIDLSARAKGEAS